MFAGGAHANSIKACSVISYSIFLFALIIANYVTIPFYIGLTLNIIFIIIIDIFAPVVHPNKSITQKTYYNLKKYCILYSIIEIILFLILNYFNITKCSTILTFSISIVAINQLIGFITYKKQI